MSEQTPDLRHGTRTKARKRALDILFEADLRECDPLETLADRITLGEHPVRPYTIALVRGVAKRQDEIDALASAHLTNWTLDRMPRIDRALARIAIFEMLDGDVPRAIAIDEAVSLARELSTDESPDYLNGMLGAVARELASVEA